MKPTSFLIQFGNASFNPDEAKESFTDDVCTLFVNTKNDNHIRWAKTDNGFVLFIGERLNKTSPETSKGKLPGQGTLISYDSRRSRLSIISDTLGTAPIFYRQKASSGFLISNRLEHMVDADCTVSWLSVQQYLCHGYTLQNETFFKEISQSRPSEQLAISYQNGSPSLVFTNNKIGYHKQTPLTEETINQIAQTLINRMESYSPAVLMMSAGWDSRTLLINGPDPYVSAYSHGDLSSREIQITQRLTGRMRLDHIFSEINRFDFPPELLEEMLEQTGFCLFPIWYLASKRLASLYDTPLISGVLGEFLGGHYGVMSFGTRRQKALAAIMLLNNKPLSEQRIKETVWNFATPPEAHWFLTDEMNARFREQGADTRQKTLSCLQILYQKTGDWQRAIEQFNMEHRARQYILKQAQTAVGYGGYNLPFGDEKIVEMIRRIPFSQRVHNKLNRLILDTNRPDLLNQPMAATLLKAKYPIILQELSRGFRIVFENISRNLGKRPPNLGWFNYQHLYSGHCLNDITNSLQLDIWDKNKMHKTIESNPHNGIDAGSTLDMLTKIKTVDYYVNLSTRKSTQNN